MAATEKTKTLGLNRWLETDCPERADFVADNDAIEKFLAEHLGSSTMHLTAAEKTRVSQPIQIFTYLGNGVKNRTYTLNFSPRAVFIIASGKPMSRPDGDYLSIYSAAQVGVYSTPGLKMSGKQAALTQQSLSDAQSAANGLHVRLNESNVQYVGIAVR